MPSRYPVEVRRQVVELARSGTRVAQLAETFGMTEASLTAPRSRRRRSPSLSSIVASPLRRCSGDTASR